METYKVTVWSDKFSPFFGFYRGAETKEMTYRELYEERMKVLKWITTDFRWEDYPRDYCHLVYCVKQGDEFTLYPYGYLMTEREFEEKVASQLGSGLQFDLVWAYHKL